MKFIIVISLITFSFFPGESTKVEREIYKLEKPVNGFSIIGTQSYVKGTGQGLNASSFPAKIEMKSLDEGFIIRNNAHIIYFDDNFDKIWEKDLQINDKFVAFSYSILKANKNILYFIEVRTGGMGKESVYVNMIDREGVHRHQEINYEEPGKDLQDLYLHTSKDYATNNFFINNRDELCRINAYENKAKKNITYKIHKLSPSLQLSEEIVELPVNPYEVEKGTKHSQEKTSYFWTILGRIGNNTLFTKAYFQDTEIRKTKRIVLETVELTSENKLVNHKIWPFNAYVIDEERKFAMPTLTVDDHNSEIYLSGFIAVDNKELNASYLIKYDYNSQQLIYNKEFTFKELLKNKESKFIKSDEISYKVKDFIPMKISEKDIHLSKESKSITIDHISDLVLGTNKWTATYISSKFDKYGDLVATDIMGYNSNYYGYDNNVKPYPLFVEQIYKDDSRPHMFNEKTTTLDYVKNNFALAKKEEKYYMPVNRDSTSFFVLYDEDMGVFNGLRIDN